MENVTTILVPTTSIDNFCEREGIDEIHILKMDIQAGELLALKGAYKKLKEKKNLPDIYGSKFCKFISWTASFL